MLFRPNCQRVFQDCSGYANLCILQYTSNMQKFELVFFMTTVFILPDCPSCRGSAVMCVILVFGVVALNARYYISSSPVIAVATPRHDRSWRRLHSTKRAGGTDRSPHSPCAPHTNQHLKSLGVLERARKKKRKQTGTTRGFLESTRTAYPTREERKARCSDD